MAKLKTKHKDNQIIVISKLTKGEEINQQELDVMNSKIIRGMMKPKVIKHNRISYLSPNGLTLKSYLSGGVSVADFFLLFAQVLEVLKAVERNSFNVNNLVMNINTAFVNERTKELHMVYQPLRTQVISTNVASFLYDISYSVTLGLSEDYNEINRFIQFLKSLQMINVEQIEHYILSNYPAVYKQITRQKPGQSKALQGEDIYYRRGDFGTNGKSSTKKNDYAVGSEAYVAGNGGYDGGYGMGGFAAGNDAGDTALLNEDPYDEDATSLLVSEDDDMATSLLTDENSGLYGAAPVKVYPYIIRTSTFDRIDVNKPVFRIGKERSYVDYFVQNNNAVSRLHADIITRGNKYFIKDNNSTNRTFVNGVDIPADQEVEIFDGDEFVLANEPFEFHVS